MSCTCTQLFSWIGYAVVGIWLLKAVLRLKRFYIGHFTQPTVDFRSLGKYAVITGATDGIGKAYAFELAKYGMDLVLISRTMTKLQNTAAELRKQFPKVDVKVIAADFQRTDIYDQIEQELKGLDIGVLVNNVGALLPFISLHEMARQDVLNNLNINMTSTVAMSHLTLPAMVAKKRGLIVNMSSASGFLPPAYVPYSASKTFVTRFSQALRIQYGGDGIIVLDVQPFFVDTNLAHGIQNKTVVTPETCVRDTLRTVGHYDETCGATRHDVLSVAMSLVPESRFIKLVHRMERKAAERMAESSKHK